MSVNTSEEYLDELLQAIEPIIYTEEPVLDAKQNSLPEPVVKEEAVEIAEKMPEKDEVSTDSELPIEEVVSVSDLLETLDLDEGQDSEEESVSEEDIDAMLSAAVNAASANEGEVGNDVSAHDEDVRELLKQFTDDEDLSDINDILDRHDNSEAVDESVLYTPEVEVFQLEEEQEEPEEEKAKGLFGFFKKRKKNRKANKKIESDNEKGTQEEIEQFSVDSTLKDNVEVEIGAQEWEKVNTEENTVSVEAVETLDAELILGDNDTSDIEMLLSGGTLLENEKSYDEELQGLDEKGTVPEKSGKKKSKSAKKESLFSKIFNMLTEEEDETTKKGSVPEADVTVVTDENLAILDELSKEDKKKAKLAKKEQRKKEKEAKKNGKAIAEGEEEEEGDSKKEKKPKKVKVKKEKTRKVVELDAKPEKKLSRKKISLVFLFCFSILAMILILQNVLLDFGNLKEARWAFDNADYETCYANLYGRDLSEEDEEIFEKSYVILCVQRKLDSYENFVQLDMELEALNALFEGVRVYRDVEERAGELGILDRISGTYQTIYDNLLGYGLEHDEIEEILDYESKVTYTRRLTSIVNGTSFEDVVGEASEESVEVSEEIIEEENEELNIDDLEDVLPQEQEFLGDL